MFERLKALYEKGRISKEGLKAAVKNGWITEEEYNIIVGE